MTYDLAYINSLIEDKIEESLQLEYKGSGSLNSQNPDSKEISKDVSAMANSAGGIIIYGINEDQTNRKPYLPSQINPINRHNFSKERLEQIINSNIQPKINNLIIHPILTNENDEVVYIVDIPQSTTVHQAKDKKYYKRYNFESVAMDDYEIKDIINRSKNPIITIDFLITQNAPNKLQIFIENTGKVFAQYVNYFVYFPKEIIRNIKSPNYQQIQIEDKEYDVVSGLNTDRDIVDYEYPDSVKGKPYATFLGTPKYGTAYYVPILPGIKRRYEIIGLLNDIEMDDRIIKWETYADNAEKISGEVKLSDIPFEIEEIAKTDAGEQNPL
jgi:hypothetical protein